MKNIYIVAAMLVTLGGCATSADKPSYGNPQTSGNTYSVRYGKIVEVREVNIEGYHDGLGTYGGGLVGYEVGRTLGGGSGSNVAGAVVSVAGAIAGRAVQEKATSKDGYELTIQYDNGDTVVVVQPKADEEVLRVDDPVRVLVSRSGSARVQRR